VKRSKIVFIVTALILALSITTLSAQSPATSQPLATAAQAQVEGGLSCGGALGLGAGLAVGALTPCSIICAVGAWYSLAAIAYAC
jgi:hypothetical protein